MLYLYNFFHLNLAYSAIEEEKRSDVIHKCYWPLLLLAKEKRIPMGIEMSGYTLSCIQAIDPLWVKEFKNLIDEGVCELIGCGYAQIIAPLVPARITQENLRIGNKIYKELLGVTPSVALLNEQAYSSGLVKLYKQSGYHAVIMEWNNPSSGRLDWHKEWRYLPQKAAGTESESISVIWNDSITFQKFQRYVHGELELNEILEHVRKHIGSTNRALPVYGNDVEIFDFRPGRYMTEANIQLDGEWNKIAYYYNALLLEPEMCFILPSQVLGLSDEDEANNSLILQTAGQPVPVKKQKKYNITRWAVTGRDDVRINTICYKIFNMLMKSSLATDEDWIELCYMWSSDFRTHITESRWLNYLDRMTNFHASITERFYRSSKVTKSEEIERDKYSQAMNVRSEGRFLILEGNRLVVKLNCKKGLALECFTDRNITDVPLIGTVAHGHFEEIDHGADFYSGHFLFEQPGKHKITDLSPVIHKCTWEGDFLCITGKILTPIGDVEKLWLINDKTGELRLTYKFNISEKINGSLRLGMVTLLPTAFERDSLAFSTHNGGDELESFKIGNGTFDHGSPVSSLVSANQALGVTEGYFAFSDKRKKITVSFDKCESAMIAYVSNVNVRESFLTRVSFSQMEFDDSSKPRRIGIDELSFRIRAETV